MPFLVPLIILRGKVVTKNYHMHLSFYGACPLWTLAEEKGVAHEVADSRNLARTYYEAVMQYTNGFYYSFRYLRENKHEQ